MKLITLLILCLVFSLPALASGKLFYFSVAAKGALGKGATKDGEALESRSLYVFGGEAILGFRVSAFMIGASAEYNIWRQKEEPKEVGNSNISGKQVSFGPVIAVPLGRFMFQVKFPISSKFTMDNEASTGAEVEYKSPSFPPYSFMLAYSLGHSFIGVEYSKIEYKKISLDGVETTVNSNDRLALSSVGIVYGYKF